MCHWNDVSHLLIVFGVVMHFVFGFEFDLLDDHLRLTLGVCGFV